MKAVYFSGSKALSMLMTQAFEGVISDFHMLGTSALEFLNKIRQDHKNAPHLYQGIPYEKS